MSDETTTPALDDILADETPTKKTTKKAAPKKAEPTTSEKIEALADERRTLDARIAEIKVELSELTKIQSEEAKALPVKTDHERWLEQQAIEKRLRGAENAKKNEIRKALEELGLA